MKVAAMFLALALGGVAISGCAAKPPFGKIEQYTGRIDLPNGDVCSGTRSYTAIITSRHCLEGPSKQLRFQGILVNVETVMIRGENIWVFTDRNWGPPPKMAKPPKKGEPLYLIGNPANGDQLARTATLAGTMRTPIGEVFVVTCACWHGDSGAGIFNAKGELVGVFLGAFNFGANEASGVPSLFALPVAVPVL